MADDPNIYLIDDETGEARIHTASGEKYRLDMFEQDPTDAVPPPTSAQTDADIERLGLSEFLPDEEK